MSKEIPTVSEQLEAKRIGSIEKDDTMIIADLHSVFREYKTVEERSAGMMDRLEEFGAALTEAQRKYMAAEITASTALSNEDAFVDRMLPVAKYYLRVQEEDAGRLEAIQRQSSYRRNPKRIELNQLFAYETKPGEIELHVPVNRGTMFSDKLRLIDDGLRKLANIVRNNPDIKRVIGRSRIVGKRPGLLTRLGFSVSEIVDYGPGEREGLAIISREKLIELYGSV